MNKVWTKTDKMLIAIYVSLMALFCYSEAHAEAKPTYEVHYISGSGAQITPVEAILKSSQGEKVYKCQTVEAKVSKSLTSIGIKNVKKPKILTKQEADEQIKAIQEQVK